MNLFARQMKLEDIEGINFPEGQLITEGDEGESVAAAVAEVTEEEAGVVEDERAMDQLGADEETLSEVESAVEEAPKMEHGGLTPINARLAKIVMGRIVGKAYVERKFPKMEHFNGRADSRDATSFVQEGVKEALKSFWEALKAQFKKIWAKLKTWYVKTFSAAKKLNQRAVEVRSRAESSSSTIDKRSFSFNQLKQLSVEGKLKDFSAFKSSLEVVAEIVQISHTVDSDAVIDGIDTVVDALKAIDDESVDASNLEKLGHTANLYVGRYENIISEANTREIAETKLKEQLGGGDNGLKVLQASKVLPGDTILVVTLGKTADTDKLAVIRGANVVFANSKYKPKEISGDAEVVTLNPSQISELCNIIVEASANIYDYEAKWAKVDRAQEAYLRKMDELARDAIDDAKEEDDKATSNSNVERQARTFINTTTQFVKRVGATPSKISSYAMPVFAATLNWCEGSMRNYKK